MCVCMKVDITTVFAFIEVLSVTWLPTDDGVRAKTTTEDRIQNSGSISKSGDPTERFSVTMGPSQYRKDQTRLLPVV